MEEIIKVMRVGVPERNGAELVLFPVSGFQFPAALPRDAIRLPLRPSMCSLLLRGGGWGMGDGFNPEVRVSSRLWLTNGRPRIKL